MRITHPQYRSDTSESKYPFGDDCTLTTADGLKIPNDLVIDATVYVTGETAPLSLISIALKDLLATFNIGVGQVVVCSGSVDLSADVQTGVIKLKDTLDRPAGVLILAPNGLKILRGWNQGTNLLEYNAAQFVPSCTIPDPAIGVRLLRAEDTPGMADDVWIVGENGVMVTQTTEGYVRVDIVGEPLAHRALCSTFTAFNPPTFVTSINKIAPTYWGGFTITAGNVLTGQPALRISQEDNVITIGLAAR